MQSSKGVGHYHMGSPRTAQLLFGALVRGPGNNLNTWIKLSGGERDKYIIRITGQRGNNRGGPFDPRLF